MLSRSEILRAIRSAARKLKRAPTRAEFMRLTGIHYGRLIPHFPCEYRLAIRADGLSPDPGGLRVSPPTVSMVSKMGVRPPCERNASIASATTFM
jgi:hypothetical protein